MPLIKEHAKGEYRFGVEFEGRYVLVHKNKFLEFVKIAERMFGADNIELTEDSSINADEEMDCPTCKGKKTVECPVCDGTGAHPGLRNKECKECDGEGRYRCDTCEGLGVVSNGAGLRAFEMPIGGSNGLPFTLDNIIKLKHLFAAMKDAEISTDESCGMHMHISFPTWDATNAIWFTLNTAYNMYDEPVSTFLNPKIFPTEWEEITYAKTRYLKAIQEDLVSIVDEDDPKQLISAIRLIDHTKYNLFRIHPQGTLEWRGPRNFLNNYDSKLYTNALKILWKFVSYVDETINTSYMEIRKPKTAEIIHIQKSQVARLVKNGHIALTAEKYVKLPVGKRLIVVFTNYMNNEMPLPKFFDSNSAVQNYLIEAVTVSNLLGESNGIADYLFKYMPITVTKINEHLKEIGTKHLFGIVNFFGGNLYYALHEKLISSEELKQYIITLINNRSEYAKKAVELSIYMGHLTDVVTAMNDSTIDLKICRKFVGDLMGFIFIGHNDYYRDTYKWDADMTEKIYEMLVEVSKQLNRKYDEMQNYK